MDIPFEKCTLFGISVHPYPVIVHPFRIGSAVVNSFPGLSILSVFQFQNSGVVVLTVQPAPASAVSQSSYHDIIHQPPLVRVG